MSVYFCLCGNLHLSNTPCCIQLSFLITYFIFTAREYKNQQCSNVFHKARLFFLLTFIYRFCLLPHCYKIPKDFFLEFATEQEKLIFLKLQFSTDPAGWWYLGYGNIPKLGNNHFVWDKKVAFHAKWNCYEKDNLCLVVFIISKANMSISCTVHRKITNRLMTRLFNNLAT